jgi:SAM-dependent methyltransferase
MSAPLEAMGREVLDRLSLNGDERVLDAGCGTGRVTAALLERLPDGEVVAVDGSPAMVEAARERLGDRVELRVADLLELELDRLGWTDVWTWYQHVRVEPDDPHEYLGTVALGEHLERLDEPLRAPFVDAVLELLDEPVVDYVRLNILARNPS